MMNIINILLAAIGLGILVFIHELGHYFMARRTGMVVEAFSIGFGKPIASWKWQGVQWKIGWLPFGGYVKIAGMEVSKSSKGSQREPHDIPNGFFNKKPWARIQVALAGPLSNILLALVFFTLIWASGGREKPFAEFTKLVGWVDPQSELFVNGLRPGDEILSYDDHPLLSSKDHYYAAMLGDRNVEVKGLQVDYSEGKTHAFNYLVHSYPHPLALDSGVETLGVLSPASYLLYERQPGGMPNQLPEGSPLAGAGLQYGDRLFWVDGLRIFSVKQLGEVLNSRRALVTIQRGNQTLLARVPRVPAFEFRLTKEQRDELMDWRYAAGLTPRLVDLYTIPYEISSSGRVTGQLEFIDQEDRVKVFPLHLFSALEEPLQSGDRIMAVDGRPVASGVDVLRQIQQPQVHIIVQRNPDLIKEISWKNEDEDFLRSSESTDILKIAHSIGTPHLVAEAGEFRLLNPVVPKKAEDFPLSEAARATWTADLLDKQREVEKIQDPERRARALSVLRESQNKLMLGVYLQDRPVRYNPPPQRLFMETFEETGRVLLALVSGYLNPKWLSGPIGIVQVLHHGWSLGIKEALFWLGVISLNLGILNLLPIPVLDGGYICLSLWEMITRRRLRARTMERLIVPFVVLLIGFFVFVTYQDIYRLLTSLFS